MNRILVAALCCGVLACSSGSGGDTNNNNNNGGSVSNADLEKAFHALTCEEFVCFFGVPPSDPCPASSDESIFAKALETGRVKVDSAKAKDCVTKVNAFKGATCWGANPAGATTLDAALTACEGALSGTVAVGGDCFESNECADGFCDFGNNACPGKCAAKKAAGAACNGNAECAAGLSCEEDENFDGHCTALAAENAACSDTQPCARGLVCDDTAHTCQKQTITPIGGDCFDDSECGDAAICFFADPEADTGKCQAKAAEGGTCTQPGSFIFINAAECQGNQVCLGVILDDNGDTTKPGKCAPPADVGGTCDPTASDSGPGANGCYLGLVCDPATSKCATPPAAGSPCIAGECGPGAFCNAGNCVAQKGAGEACQASIECVHDCGDDDKCTAGEPDDTCLPK